MSDPTLVEQARFFATDVTKALQGSLPDAPEATARVKDDRVVVEVASVDLCAKGEKLATLSVLFRCQLDRSGKWLAIEESVFALHAKLDRIPLFRVEYRREPKGKNPAAHLHVHAHRGALSHLLSRVGHRRAHDMASLHFPLGGPRFRPCLEDMIEFLIVECKFDHKRDWRRIIREGRERWRRTQLRAAVRDVPEEAAQVLEDLGYTVVRPPDPSTQGARTLRSW